MPITPEKFLVCSRTLLNCDTATEADLRSAISRAYYSLYHETRLHLQSAHSKELLDAMKEELRKRNKLPIVNLAILATLIPSICNLWD